MKVQARISLIEKEAGSVLNQLGIHAEVRHGDPIVHLYIDDVRYQKLMDEARTKGFHFNEEKKLIFEKEEMESGEFYHIVLKGEWGYPEPQENYGRKSFDSSTACRVCGTGAKQVHPFSVRGTPRFGRGDMISLFWVYEYVVTERLRNVMESAGLTGVEFWPLMAFSERGQEHPLKGVWQLYITSVLPPMSPKVKFPTVRLPRGTEPCVCGRIGRNLPIEPLRYRRADLANATDFNKSKEWLGGGFDTAQLKIVSRRVYNLFIKNKIRGVDFEPVIIED